MFLGCLCMCRHKGSIWFENGAYNGSHEGLYRPVPQKDADFHLCQLWLPQPHPSQVCTPSTGSDNRVNIALYSSVI